MEIFSRWLKRAFGKPSLEALPKFRITWILCEILELRFSSQSFQLVVGIWRKKTGRFPKLGELPRRGIRILPR